MSSSARVVVVGGGVIGLSCAYYATRAGANVVLLERDSVGAGASSGNAGTVSAGHPPLNGPGRVSRAIRDMVDPASPLYVKPRWDPALWRWLLGFARRCTHDHVRHCMSIMAPLGKDALALFEVLMQEEQLECEYRAEGYYDVCSTEAGFVAARAEADIIRAHEYHPEAVGGTDLRRAEPALGDRVVGGVFYPEAATLDPARFLSELVEVARRRGCEIRTGCGVGRVSETGSHAAVETSSGEVIEADAVVLATGPFAGDLTARFGVRLPVQPGKGYHRDVEVGPNGAPRLASAFVLHETSVFCTPMGTRVRLAGTMEFSGLNRAMHPARLRQITRAARAALPGMGTARPSSEWCGLRPVSVDGLPIVGRLPGTGRIYVATGHGMLGLTLGPVTGQMLANLIIQGDEPRLSGLSPDRFLS